MQSSQKAAQDDTAVVILKNREATCGGGVILSVVGEESYGGANRKAFLFSEKKYWRGTDSKITILFN